MRIVAEIFKTIIEQVGKTIIWLPWAILELLRGDLGPDAAGLLAASVIGTIGLFAAIGVMIRVILYDGMVLASFPWLFTFEMCAMAYIFVGALTRFVGRHLWILR